MECGGRTKNKHFKLQFRNFLGSPLAEHCLQSLFSPPSNKGHSNEGIRISREESLRDLARPRSSF